MKNIIVILAATLAGAAHAAPVSMLNPVPYADGAIVAGKIKRECTIDVQLADAIKRFAAGKGPLGFANPSLYGLGNGAIADVLPPSTPTAVLRNGGANGQATTIRTINSVPIGTTGTVVEGADTSLRTTAGYDNVTGLGTPVGPGFVTALRNRP